MLVNPYDFPWVTAVRLRRTMVLDPMSGKETLGDWEAPDELPIEDCLFAPGTTNEFPNVDLALLSSLATLYLPLHADVSAGDRVRVDGAMWSVEGRRADWGNGGGDLEEGSVVNLRFIREEAS